MFEDAGETWSGVRLVGFSSAPVSTHYVDIGSYIDDGIASLREHEAYIAGLGQSDFDPDEFLRSGARRVGEQVGCDYAVNLEVFEL